MMRKRHLSPIESGGGEGVGEEEKRDEQLEEEPTTSVETGDVLVEGVEVVEEDGADKEGLTIEELLTEAEASLGASDDEDDEEEEPEPEEDEKSWRKLGEKREKKELKGILPRMKSVIRTMIGDPKYPIKTSLTPMEQMRLRMQGQDPETSYFRSPPHVDPVTGQKNKEFIYLPPVIRESSESVALGIAAHESCHTKNTRKEFIRDQEAGLIGFMSARAAIEERNTDQGVRVYAPGLTDAVDEMRWDQVHDVEEIVADLGFRFPPRLSQFSNAVVFGPHYADITKAGFSEEVLEAYERIQKHVEWIENHIPADDDAPEEVVLKYAKERYKRYYKKVWPEAKKLIDKDIKDQEAEQLLREVMKQLQKERQQQEEQERAEAGDESEGEPEPGGEGEPEEAPGPLEGMPEEIKKLLEKIQEIADKIKELDEQDSDEGEEEEGADIEAGGDETEDGDDVAAGTDDKSVDGEKETGEVPEESDKKPGEDGEETEEDAGVGDGEVEVEGDEAKGTPTGGEETDEESDEDGEPVPMKGEGEPDPREELEKEMQELLKELFDSLPDDVKKEIQKMAERAMQDLDDAIQKELSGDFEDPDERPENHEERREREEKEEKEFEEELKREEEQEKLDKMAEEDDRKEREAELDKSEYDKVYDEMREVEGQLYQRLEDIFNPTIKTKPRLEPAGDQINLDAVYRWDSARKAGARTVDANIFEVVAVPEKFDFAFTILNDLSGSMQGSKIKQDFKAKVMLTEALERLGVKYEILGFQDVIVEYKPFEHSLDNDTRNKMSRMVREVYNANPDPGANNHANNNDDAPCLLEASDRFGKQFAQNKFLIVISDGQPAGSHSNADDLRAVINHITSTTDQNLIGLGLGYGTDHVKDYYPTAIPNIMANDLPEVLGGLLEKMILNPQDFQYHDTDKDPDELKNEIEYVREEDRRYKAVRRPGTYSDYYDTYNVADRDDDDYGY